jgi:hypothetical protein
VIGWIIDHWQLITGTGGLTAWIGRRRIVGIWRSWRATLRANARLIDCEVDRDAARTSRDGLTTHNAALMTALRELVEAMEFARRTGAITGIPPPSSPPPPPLPDGSEALPLPAGTERRSGKDRRAGYGKLPSVQSKEDIAGR